MIRLYNTLTKKVETLQPASPKTVSLYTCGPTVYDRAHIGNFRTYIFEDTLRRTLRLSGYDVKHVMNVTDVDDKTITRSLQQYPSEEPLAGLKKLTRKYEEAFNADASRTGIDLSNSKIIRATEEIEAMQELITKIKHKYVSEDGVYFNIEQYPDYGIFVALDRSHTHHRIANDEYDKEHVADFALWKTKKPGEPSWDFEIEGKNISGRPGWHIECSAIAIKYLGQPFDIHTGGVDLAFPHHENEVAQTKSASGKDLAKLFMHAQHLLVDGKKMSKSLKNFYTIDDIAKKEIDPLAFRLLVLQAHYRSQMNFTWESLDGAAARLKKYRDFALRRFQSVAPGGESFDAHMIAAPSEQLLPELQKDLDTPALLAKVDAYIDKVQGQDLSSRSWLTEDYLRFIDQALGLGLLAQKDISDEQKELISDRESARKNGDWKQSDELRAKLLKQGIEINDTAHGPIWSRA